MRCPSCKKNNAIIHPTFGMIWCLECTQNRTPMKSSKFPEFVPSSVKEERKKYKKDITQPFREGVFSKEYRDYYPERSKQMVKAGTISEREFKQAKRVWDGE